MKMVPSMSEVECEHLSVPGDADAAGPPGHTLNSSNASDYLRRAVKKYLSEKKKIT